MLGVLKIYVIHIYESKNLFRNNKVLSWCYLYNQLRCRESFWKRTTNRNSVPKFLAKLFDLNVGLPFPTTPMKRVIESLIKNQIASP